MWNNTRLLNLFANTLYLLAILILVQLAAIAIINSPWVPLHHVRVHGDLEHVKATDVKQVLAGHPLGNFFSADLTLVRERIEALPWVRRVGVRRAWPDTLEIEIEEHRAFARWSDRMLVNTYGELFAGTTRNTLPRFSGPTANAIEITHRYHQFRERLRALELEIVQVALSPRHSWEVRLADGMVIELGRDQTQSSVLDRLDRFVQAYPTTVSPLNRRLSYVDLRYANGFALRVPEIMQIDKNTPEQRARQPAARKRV